MSDEETSIDEAFDDALAKSAENQDEVVTDDDGQVAAFPDQQKITNLTNDIERGWEAVERILKQFPEHGTFFKKFGEFANVFEPYEHQVLVEEMLRIARDRLAEMENAVTVCAEQMAKAQDKTVELDELTSESKGAEDGAI